MLNLALCAGVFVCLGIAITDIAQQARQQRAMNRVGLVRVEGVGRLDGSVVHIRSIADRRFCILGPLARYSGRGLG